jgi:hypothetical protein
MFYILNIFTDNSSNTTERHCAVIHYFKDLPLVEYFVIFYPLFYRLQN